MKVSTKTVRTAMTLLPTRCTPLTLGHLFGKFTNVVLQLVAGNKATDAAVLVANLLGQLGNSTYEARGLPDKRWHDAYQKYNNSRNDDKEGDSCGCRTVVLAFAGQAASDPRYRRVKRQRQKESREEQCQRIAGLAHGRQADKGDHHDQHHTHNRAVRDVQC
jgi:hypothetical protein